MKDRSPEREDSRIVVQPDDDLVAAKLPELRERLRQIVASGPCEMVLDLNNVQFVDSTGIGLLLATNNSVKKAGGNLQVIHASEDLMNLFRAMHIHQHIRVETANS